MVTQEVKVRHGVELERRKCKRKGCPAPTFWVSKKSKTKHCSLECQVDDGVTVKPWVLAKIRGQL